MDVFKQIRGWIWNDTEGKYELAPEPVTTDPKTGERRDYGIWYDDKGVGYRCGLPGERIARSKPPEDWAEKMAKHSVYNAAEIRGLYGPSLFKGLDG